MLHRLLRLVLAASLAFSAFALSASADDDVVVDLGFGGRYHLGPVAFRVTLTNRGEDAAGELVVDSPSVGDPAQYVLQLDLPRGSKKCVTVYATVLTQFAETKLWWRPRGKPARELPLGSPRILFLDDTLVLVASNDPGANLPGASGKPQGRASDFFSVRIEPAMLPSAWFGLAGVELLYLRGLTAQDLTPEQAQAITEWVEAGGRLLLSGGASPATPLATPDRRWLPGTITGRTRMEAFPAWVKKYGEMKSSPTELAVLAPEEGAEIHCSEGDVPLAVVARRGLGSVAFVAFDPAADPFRHAAGLGQLWDDLLDRHARRNEPFLQSGLQREIQEILAGSQAPPLRTFVIATIAISLFLVLLAAVQRRQDRLPRALGFALLSTPCVALGVGFVVYAFSVLDRSGDRIDAISFLVAPPGARFGAAHSFDSFWHASPGLHEETAPGRPSLCLEELRPLLGLRREARFTWREGEQACRLQDLEFRPNSSRVFHTLAGIDLGDGIQSDLELGDEGGLGGLVNRTPWPWRDAWLLSRRGEEPLGDVPIGGTVRAPKGLRAAMERVGVTQMVRGNALHFGLAQIVRSSWDWPSPPGADAAPETKPKGDLVLVAFVDLPSPWQAIAGRLERRTTALVVPLPGRDLRKKEGAK
ncbi:MAG: hypothetical protein HYZ53_16795 [Planctomycetes bacterium]|nr:hypothetical protein [Planctomycetota bacterium]